MENTEELAKQLWAIGDATRLRILCLLPDEDDCARGKNVSQLAEKLGLSQPTISHHLRVLRQAGIIQHQKKCRDCYYWIDREAARGIIGHMQELLITVEPAPRAR